MKKYSVGVDVGGTSIKAGLVSDGKVLSKAVVNTNISKGRKGVVENIVKAVESVCISDISSVGVGCPGPLDYRKGVILRTPNLPLKNFALKRILEKRLKKNFVVDNDGNCFALGEALYGAGNGHNCVVGLTLGTGVGGGIVVDKKIFHGYLNAGELGHMTIDYKGYKSRCGNFGCIEEHLSARAILRMAGLRGIHIKSPEELFELASRRDKGARDVFKDYGTLLGVAAANITYAIDPEIIVVGGQIADAWSMFSKSMQKALKKRLMTHGVRVIKAKLNDAGIIGAASLI